jgi:hypothetical protein
MKFENAKNLSQTFSLKIFCPDFAPCIHANHLTRESFPCNSILPLGATSNHKLQALPRLLAVTVCVFVPHACDLQEFQRNRLRQISASDPEAAIETPLLPTGNDDVGQIPTIASRDAKTKRRSTIVREIRYDL